MGHSNLSASTILVCCSCTTTTRQSSYYVYILSQHRLPHPLSSSSSSVSKPLLPIDPLPLRSSLLCSGPSYSHSPLTNTTATADGGGASFHYGPVSAVSTTSSVPFEFPAYTAAPTTAPATAAASGSLGSHTLQIQAQQQQQPSRTNHFHLTTLSLNSSSDLLQNHLQPQQPQHHQQHHQQHQHHHHQHQSQDHSQDQATSTTTPSSTSHLLTTAQT